MIKRREFLLGIGASSLTACMPAHPVREPYAQGATNIDVRTQVRGNTLLSGFLGLSFEAALLSDPHWFADPTLAALMRSLVPDGVLRIGGESSDLALWKGQAGALPAPYTHAVTPADIDRLAGLLEATGWRLVYGLNLGHGDPQRAADEAAYVANRLGDRLDAFQIGNEPDLYDRHGLRPAGYTVDSFVSEWRSYAGAIRARAGDVPLAGPDVAYRTDWIDAFARSCAGEVAFLSDHYYPVGPARDPHVDIRALLQSEGQRDELLKPAISSGQRFFRPLRMTEANSCFGGGKPGVSDTAAAALWAIDTGMALCRQGWMGLYFHGGPDAVYSPIRRDPTGALHPTPLYYGMLMLAQAAPLTLVDLGTPEHAEYLRYNAGVTADGRLCVMIVNPNQANSADVRIDAGRPLKFGSILRLRAPTLFSTDQIELGGAAVGADGNWKPGPVEPAAVQGHSAYLTVQAAGAVLLTLD